MSNIEIKEKPLWVSWEGIHELLWKAHEKNREQGINMKFPSLPGDEIRKRIEGQGKMFVALDGNKLVGAAALKVKRMFLWCGKHKYAYLCFAGVLPEYSGKGIYNTLLTHIEREAQKIGQNCVMFDTHEMNHRLIGINKKAGYQMVDILIWKDHYNVVMVKWLSGCPYSDWYCRIQFLVHKWYRKLRFKPGRIKRLGI